MVVCELNPSLAIRRRTSEQQRKGAGNTLRKSIKSVSTIYIYISCLIYCKLNFALGPSVGLLLFGIASSLAEEHPAVDAWSLSLGVSLPIGPWLRKGIHLIASCISQQFEVVVVSHYTSITHLATLWPDYYMGIPGPSRSRTILAIMTPRTTSHRTIAVNNPLANNNGLGPCEIPSRARERFAAE